MLPEVSVDLKTAHHAPLDPSQSNYFPSKLEMLSQSCFLVCHSDYAIREMEVLPVEFNFVASKWTYVSFPALGSSRS